MLLEIRHVTQYHYEKPVRESLMELWMQPQKSARQRLVSFELDLEPAAQVFSYADSFGNAVAPSADGALLWIAQTPPGTVTNTLVSLIDPVTRQVTQVLEHTEPIDLLHPTADGRFLFLRIADTTQPRCRIA